MYVAKVYESKAVVQAGSCLGTQSRVQLQPLLKSVGAQRVTDHDQEHWSCFSCTKLVVEVREQLYITVIS